MKAGWKTVKLGEVLDKTENIDPTDFPEKEYDYIDVSSVSNKSFSIEETQRIKGKDAPSRARKLVRTNDVIFATIRPTLQRIAIIPELLDGQICSTGYLVLRPKEIISSRFIYYALMTDSFRSQMELLQKGSSYPAVTDGDVRNQLIPLPPLAEQKRIVALLDEAFAGIDEAKAKAEANLEDTSMILKSYLNSIFSQGANEWAEKTLGETCEMYQPKTIGMKDLIPDGPYPVFGANGVIGKYDKYNHEEPQLLITCRGATCGAVNISEPNSWITGNAMVVRPKDGEIDLQFLEFFFRGGVDISVAITGSAQPQITRTNLEPLTVRFPKSVVEQENHVKAFKSLTDETRTLANIYAQKLLMLNQLKNTLLAQAFAGELTA